MPSDKQLSFETTVLQFGNNTGIEIPGNVVEKLGAGKKPPVKVSLNKYTFRNSIFVYGGKYMIGISAAHRNKSGIKGGDCITVTLELDTQPREVVLPEDLKKTLDKNPKAKQHFEKLSYSNKLHYVLIIEQAKNAATRQRRIDKAVLELKAGMR